MCIEKMQGRYRTTLNSWVPASNGHSKLPSRSCIFLLLTYFPIPQEYNFIPSFSPLKLPTFLALSHMMTSHFMDKIEKSSSLYQTCNLQWGPFSPSLLWLKWKNAHQPIKVQFLLHAPGLSFPQILSYFGCSLFLHYQFLSQWVRPTTKQTCPIIAWIYWKQNKKHLLTLFLYTISWVHSLRQIELSVCTLASAFLVAQW